MVRGSPVEAFAKGGDSDEHRSAPSLVSERYNTWAVLGEPLKKIINAPCLSSVHCGSFKSQICRNCLMWSYVLSPTQNDSVEVTLFPQDITKRLV
jgi:hypothetical protein